MISRVLFKVVCGAGEQLCRYRGRHFTDRFERAVDYFHRKLNNVNLDMTTNGELRALRLLGIIEPKCVFDVGANTGEWSQLVSQLYPSCSIHAFEIVPSTFQELVQNTKSIARLIPNNFGLSDEPGTISISLGSDDTRTATACKIEGMKYHDQYYGREIQCEVRKASDYVREKDIAGIDFVKIDVEGMDLRVIKGFEESIGLVRALQFEYSAFNIASHDFLRDFCSYLNGHGFAVGKIFPRCVDFFEYHFGRENFQASNYVAVRKDEQTLIEKLSHFGA
jgi:FkbM family methyltransferase